MIHCTFSRDFKAAALNELRQKESDPKKRQQIIKVEGKKRVKMFSAWIDKQLNAIEAACKSLGNKKMKRIHNDITNIENKTSHSDNNKKKQLFLRETRSGKPWIIEWNNLADVTAWMEGTIILSYLTGTNKAKPYILAELDARRVKLSAEKKKNDLKERDLTPLLRQHEVTRLQEEEEKYVKDPKREVPTIKLLSEKMKEWFPIQWEIYKKWKGVADDV
jgi:hypothetical protein